MTWAINVDVKGNLPSLLEGDRKAGAAAVSEAFRRRGKALHTSMRTDATGKLSKRVGNAIRFEMWPTGRRVSMRSRVLVHSKNLYGRPGGLVDLITAFTEGFTANQYPFWMPVPAAGMPNHGQARARPDFYPRGTFLFLKNKGEGGRLVWRHDKTRVAFWMRHETMVGPRLKTEVLIKRAERNIDGYIVTIWERKSKQSEAAAQRRTLRGT